ncbi:hypothetical protein EJ02DRAFT_444070 [Clathrospora elynae]|uniref:Uncharacterized protein n=1 Tax=Clathrospora elynae TaxID=706981 RepID=A0A6A5SRT9_9PLEO|nr:hypothetical protein EJ02DRAFT_444070 [Clathrospora elynae]
MKFILVISTMLYTTAVIAAPGAFSLKRSFKTLVRSADDAGPSDEVHIACVECPCPGFSGDCQCVYQGCCCDWTVPGMPPAGGWKV